MHLESLRLFNFRNISEDSVKFSPGVNFIIGRNGQGKTNLIEAIHVLAYSKSFRTSHVKELVHWSGSSMSVFGSVKHALWDCEVGVSFEAGTKLTYLNGEKTSLINGYLGKLVCVTFAPDDLSLIKAGPSQRRKFTDRFMTVLNPSLIMYLLDYQKAIRNKNAILKESYPDVQKIIPWNQIAANNAYHILCARKMFLSSLEQRAGRIHSEFAETDGELTLKLKSNCIASDGEPAKDEIIKKLEENIEREVAARSSLIGPHRDDIIIKLSGVDARLFASQGQSRSIVLSLKLAVIEMIEETFKESPVVLLDDVESELDKKRSERFFNMILNGERQAFITGTDAGIINKLGKEEACQIISINDGKVERNLAKLSA